MSLLFNKPASGIRPEHLWRGYPNVYLAPDITNIQPLGQNSARVCFVALINTSILFSNVLYSGKVYLAYFLNIVILEGLTRPVTYNLAVRRARAQLVLAIQILVRPNVVQLDDDLGGLYVRLFDRRRVGRLSPPVELNIPLVNVVDGRRGRRGRGRGNIPIGLVCLVAAESSAASGRVAVGLEAEAVVGGHDRRRR